MSIRTTGVRYDVIARDMASKPFDTIGRSAGRLEGGLGTLVKAGAVAGAALAGGLAVGLAVSAEKAVAFQSEMKKVQTQAGASAKDVKVLSAQVLELGKTTQQGPQALADSMYHLKSVGMSNVDAMKALKVSSDLAAVGGANLESTTNALAGAWRSGIRGAGDFSTAAATVNAIIGAGNMRMEEFTAAIGTGILPSAKSFGLSLNQVGAALALMTDEGIPATDAATRLRMSFSLLGAPSVKADKQLAKIGLSGTQLATAMRGPDGLIGAISLLKSHLDASGMSAVQQSQLISHAFGGGRSSSGILTLLNNLDVLKKKQDQINSSMGKFPAAVAAQRKTAEAQLKILESNLNVFAIKTGNVLLPPLTTFVTYINTKALPEVHKFGQEMVTKFIPVDQIKAGFTTVTSFVSDFFGGFSSKKSPVVTLPTPTLKMPTMPVPNTLRAPELIVPSPTISVGTARIPATLKAPVAVKSQATKLGEQVGSLVSRGIGDAIGKIDWAKAGKNLGRGVGQLLKYLTIKGSDVIKTVSHAVGSIDWVNVGKIVGGQALGFAIGFMTSMGRELFSPSFWSKHWWDVVVAALSVVGVGKIAGPLGKIFEKIPVLKSVAPFLKRVEGLTKPFGDAAGKVMKFFGSSLWKGLARIFPEGTAVLEREAGLFSTRVGVWGLDLVRLGGRAMRGLGNGIRTGFEWPIAKIGEGIGWLLKPFVKAGTWLINAGGDLLSGLRSGVSSGMTDIGRWIQSTVVDPVVNWVKNLFGIHSPSTVFASIGGYLIDGLLGGIWSGMQGVGKWLSNHVINPVIDKFSGAGGWLYSKGSGLISGLKNGIIDSVSGAGKWVSTHIKSPLVAALFWPESWLYDKGKGVLTGFFDGLKQPWKDVTKWVGGIAKWIKDHKGPVSFDRQLLVPAGHALMHGLLNGLKFGFQGVSSFIYKTGSTIADTISGITSSIFGGGHNDLVGQWATDVRTVLGMLGAPVDALSPVLTRIRIESGGNPNAINLTDSNAKAGHPSQGLMQTIPSTFAAYAGPFANRGITDPLASIYAGVNYAMHRYGSDWVKVMTRPGGYAKGGLAPIGQTAWVGERGAELMQVTSKGTRIYNHADSMALAKGAGIRLPGYAGGTVDLGPARRGVTDKQRQVNRLEQQIAALRRDEAMTRSRSRRKRDQLAVMAAEERLKAARTELTAAKHRLTTAQAAARHQQAMAQAQAKRVATVSNALQNGFLKSLETSTAAGIASAVKSMNSKLQAAGAGGMVAGNLRTASKLESLANRRSSIQSQIAAAQQYASTQSSNLGSYLSIGGTSAFTAGGLISQMTAQQKTAGRFTDEVSGLRKRGLSKDLLSQLADAGPGSQLAQALSKASGSDIARLNKLAASQAKLTVSFGQSMADAMYDSGKNAGRGFLSGLQAQEKALQKEMDRLAQGMVDAIKHKLGIRSPSTVTRDQIGKQFVLGAALGVRMHAWKATAEAQRMADTMAAVRARTGGAGGVSAGAGGGMHVDRSRTITINMNGADQSSAEQRADLLRHMQQLA